MKRTHILLILITLALVTALGTTWWYLNHDVVQVIRVPMDVKVEDHLAFNLDGDAIHFGKVAPGTGANRGFIVNSTFNFPVSTELRFTGEIAPWVSATQTIIYLEPFGYKQVNLTVNAPEEAEYGFYTGTLIAIFRRTE